MSKVTLDIICATSFGYHTDSLHNPHNELAEAYEHLVGLQSGTPSSDKGSYMSSKHLSYRPKYCDVDPNYGDSWHAKVPSVGTSPPVSFAFYSHQNSCSAVHSYSIYAQHQAYFGSDVERKDERVYRVGHGGGRFRVEWEKGYYEYSGESADEGGWKWV